MSSRAPPHWRPVVLGPWYLALVSLLSLGLAAGMEYTYQHYEKKENSSLFSFHDDTTDLSLKRYFFWRILLSLIVLAWGSLITPINYQLMRMAPYYQLASPQGLSGGDAFLRDPTSYWWYVRNPRKAGALVWACFFNALLATLIAPTVQSTVFLSTNPPDTSLTGEAYADDTAQRVSNVVIRSAGSRALSTTFAIVGLSCLSLAIFLPRRSSGVERDPGGIIGIASLLPGDTSRLVGDLRHKRFRLRNGALVVHPDQSYRSSTSTESEPQKWHPIYPGQWLFSTIVFGLFLTIFCGVSTMTNLVWYLRRVPWLLPLFATVYKLLWTQCETRFRVTEPFRQLARRPAPPSNLFVDYAGLPNILLPFSAMLNRHWALFVSGVAGNLSELLVTAVTCSGDISSYIYVGAQTFDKGTPFEKVVTTRLGNGPFYTLLLIGWIYSMVLVVLMTVWVGIMFRVGRYHDRREHHLQGDPVKLGVVLAWLVEPPADVLATIQRMRHEVIEPSKEAFENSPQDCLWVLKDKKISRAVTYPEQTEDIEMDRSTSWTAQQATRTTEQSYSSWQSNNPYGGYSHGGPRYA